MKILATGITAFLLSATGAAAQTPGYGDGHMGWGWGNGWGHVFGGGLLMLLFWVVVIGLVVYLVQALAGRKGGGSGSSGEVSDALGILDERYARGEIDKDEHEEKRRHLLQHMGDGKRR